MDDTAKAERETPLLQSFLMEFSAQVCQMADSSARIERALNRVLLEIEDSDIEIVEKAKGGPDFLGSAKELIYEMSAINKRLQKSATKAEGII